MKSLWRGAEVLKCEMRVLKISMEEVKGFHYAIIWNLLRDATMTSTHDNRSPTARPLLCLNCSRRLGATRCVMTIVSGFCFGTWSKAMHGCCLVPCFIFAWVEYPRRCEFLYSVWSTACACHIVQSIYLHSIRLVPQCIRLLYSFFLIALLHLTVSQITISTALVSRRVPYPTEHSLRQQLPSSGGGGRQSRTLDAC